MNRLIIFVFLIFCFHQLTASEMNDTSKHAIVKRWRIGITPTSFVNVFPGLQFSGEYEIEPRLSVGTEAAYIFENLRTSNNNSFHDEFLEVQFRHPNTTNGFRLRPYVKLKLLNRKNHETSLSMFYNLRIVSSNIETSIFGGDGSFFEIVRGRRLYSYQGLGLMVSQTFLLGDNVGLNFGFGAGAGYVSIRNSNTDLNKISDDYNFWFSSAPGERRYFVPIGIMHFNFFWSL